MSIKMWLSIIAIVSVVAAVSWGPIASNVEQSKYEVIEKDNNIEIRNYAPMIIAEVEMQGEREVAINNGFKALAAYIFGDNSSSTKVNMTAPVTQQQSQKIAMTAPVMQQQQTNNIWKIRFMMPSNYNLESLPKPTNESIKLIETSCKQFAAIRFSGLSTKQNIESNEQELLKFIEERSIKTIGLPTYAFFNPPWTLPFLRRNEVMVEIESKTSGSC